MSVKNGGKDPVLLIYDSSFQGNPFGKYLSEILRTEGLLFFNEMELKEVHETSLQGRSIVILAETKVTDLQRKVLIEYVNKGGILLAFRPDPELIGAFGVQVDGMLPEGYWKPEKEIGENLRTGGMGLFSIMERLTFILRTPKWM